MSNILGLQLGVMVAVLMRPSDAHSGQQEVEHLTDLLAVRPLVICGPSGVGKGTVVARIMQNEFPGHFGFACSHTTRAPREGERHGVEYVFSTREAMEPMIERGEFLESANVHGNLYGTSIAELERVRSTGKICILDVDTAGVRNIQAHESNCDPTDALRPFYLFLTPPSVDDLRQRLRARGTETTEQIERRVANAAAEIEFGTDPASGFDLVLVNDDLEATVEELVAILRDIYPHLRPARPTAAPVAAVESQPQRGLGLAGMAARRLLNLRGARTKAAGLKGERDGRFKGERDLVK